MGAPTKPCIPPASPCLRSGPQSPQEPTELRKKIEGIGPARHHAAMLNDSSTTPAAAEGAAGSLRGSLNYEPQVLSFGTSGRRGEVVHLTQFEVYINASAELEYLLSRPQAEGGIVRGEEFYFANDLRPSSTRLDPQFGGRGEMAQAICCAIADAGLQPVYLGALPTPALTCCALERRRGSMMITGSHIPFERNGYKTNTAHGELLKKDEAPINALVGRVRERLYTQPAAQSLFNPAGMFKSGHLELPPVLEAARTSYLRRYLDFFAGRTLRGRRLLVFQHSAVGRDLLVDLLRQFGAEVVVDGRSETFVPIDTENVEEALLVKMQEMVDRAAAQHGPIDAVVSTDGDSDRPLILGVDPAPSACSGSSARVRFFGGDLVGMVVAQYLGADSVVVPISCNDAIDRGALRGVLEPKTRIGSPFVIAGMERARLKGRRRICGWEANGGFLTGSDLERDGRILRALPTRDAMLPILATLFAAGERDSSLSQLFDNLPKRFSKAALLKRFPRPVSLAIIQRCSPVDPAVTDILFGSGDPQTLGADGRPVVPSADSKAGCVSIHAFLADVFSPAAGFGEIERINYTDGVRLCFSNGDVAHVRPSGNADELRIYAVAYTQARAEAITRFGVAEPGGLLRQLEQSVRR